MSKLIFLIASLLALATAGAPSLIEKEHSYKDADGNDLVGFLIYKDTTGALNSRPGLLLFVAPYGGGGGKYERDVARTYAERGMVVFLPDYFPGRHSEDDPQQVQEALGLYGPFLQDTTRAQKIALLALQQLTSLDVVDSDNVAVVGFCFGGSMALNLARAGGKAKVAVSLHGEYPQNGENLGNYDIDYFVQMIGDSDPLIPKEARDSWISELTNHTKGTDMNYDVQIWGNSFHAFSIKYSDTFYSVLAAFTESHVVADGVAGVIKYDPSVAAASFDRVNDLFELHGLISMSDQIECGGACGENTMCMNDMCVPNCPPGDPCCGEGSESCGGDGSIGTAGCVCSFDPYCCETAWDKQCIAEAIDRCDLICLNGNGNGNGNGNWQ